MQGAQSRKFVCLLELGLNRLSICMLGWSSYMCKYWLSSSNPPTNWTVSWLSPKLNLSIMSLSGNFKCNDVIFNDYPFTHARPQIQYTNIYIDWLRNYFVYLEQFVCLCLYHQMSELILLQGCCPLMQRAHDQDDHLIQMLNYQCPHQYLPWQK